MMKKYIFIKCLLVMFLFSNCGTKIIKSSEQIKNENQDYIEDVHNKNLEKKTSEGALTDLAGLKDIGKFKLTYYFDSADKQLYRIQNKESIDKTITENFYFKNKQLIFITSETASASLKKLYISKGKIINESEVDAAYGKILLNKAKMFQKDFKKISK